MATVEQQLAELAVKVDKLSAGVDLANNGVASLTKTVSKITDAVGCVDRWSKDNDKFANDLEAALQDLMSCVQALEQPSKSAPPHAPSREEGGGPVATVMLRVTRVCMWGTFLTPPWSRVSTKISHPQFTYLRLIARLVVVIRCMTGMIEGISIEGHIKILGCLE
jgi:hypothetical protein